MPVSSLPPPAKRRKASLEKELETQITAAVANNTSLNALLDLLNLAQGASDPKDLSKIIYSLYRVFVVIISSGKLSPGGNDAAKQIRKWIWERLDTFMELLIGLLQDEEPILRKSALDIPFSLLRHLSAALTKDNRPYFHFTLFKDLLRGLLLCLPSPRPGSDIQHERELFSDVRDHFVDTWLTVHDDIRWCFLREATSLLSQSSFADHPNLAPNLMSLMEGLSTFPTEPAELNEWWIPQLGASPPKPKNTKEGEEVVAVEKIEAGDDDDDDADDWRKFFDEEPSAKDAKKPTGFKGRPYQLTFHQSLHSLQAHRALFTKFWLTFLRCLSTAPASANQTLTIRTLKIMHRGILPHMTRPIFVMDWVGACVDMGGTIGLLALNALYILIKDYNLDYPQVYTRLYAFLDRDVMHSKHRARFFRLIDLFLSSTHLPAALLASFVKRLSRLSLNAPPAAIIMIIPLTYNILKRHPALMKMIHRPDGQTEDPFLPDETNPNLTNAISSSLWELCSYRNHYDTAVSTLARIFQEVFTKPSYSMEDFLDHTYGTLLETELKRKIKKEPAMAMDLTGDPFPLVAGDSSDGLAGGNEDAVSELWAFG